MKKICVILSAGMVLAGCSGSSTSNKTEDLYSDNTTMSKVKNMFRSTKNITTKEMNVATLIASTFDTLPIPLQRFTAYNSAHDDNSKTIYTQIDSVTFADEFKKSLPQLKANILLQESAIQSLESGNKIIYDRAVKALNAAKSGNDDQFLWGYNVGNIVFNSVIGEANGGCNGWMSGLRDRNGEFAEEFAIAEIAYIANALETKIADSMLDKTFYSEEDAKKYIINYAYSLSGQELFNIVRAAQDEYGTAKYTADFTGVKGIQFTVSNGSSFACTNSGLVWGKNNTDWFGAGNLSGKKYITKIEYSDSAEMGKSYKMDLNSNSTQSNSNSADTTVKSK
jgi:uncharacterized membrane protein